jgi:selenocysteine-specific elongation factor
VLPVDIHAAAGGIGLIACQWANYIGANVIGTVGSKDKAEIARHQPRRALPRNTLITACRRITHPELLDAIFRHLLKTKELVEIGPNLGPADAQVKLTKNQEQARARMLEQIAAAGLTPPTTKELAAALGQKLDQLQPLLNLCVEDGLLVKIDETLYFAPSALERARAVCERTLAELGEATMSQLREAWGVSRKFSVPLCEHFDNAGITLRREDVRVAGPNVGKPLV